VLRCEGMLSMSPFPLQPGPDSDLWKSRSVSRLGRALLLAVFLFFIGLSPAIAANWLVRTQPSKLVNGSPVLFQVTSPVPLEALSGTWLGHQITFTFNRSTKTWFALAGVSFETKPGKYTLELSADRKGHNGPITFARKFGVAMAHYPKIRAKLTVGGKFTEPSTEQLKQIEEDQKTKQDYLSRVTPERGWAGEFIAPAHADISDVYGSQRVFNDKAQRPHYGLDYRVPTGTPVEAMNSKFGKVGK